MEEAHVPTVQNTVRYLKCVNGERVYEGGASVLSCSGEERSFGDIGVLLDWASRGKHVLVLECGRRRTPVDACQKGGRPVGNVLPLEAQRLRVV